MTESPERPEFMGSEPGSGGKLASRATRQWEETPSQASHPLLGESVLKDEEEGNPFRSQPALRKKRLSAFLVPPLSHPLQVTASKCLKNTCRPPLWMVQNNHWRVLLTGPSWRPAPGWLQEVLSAARRGSGSLAGGWVPSSIGVSSPA